MAIAEKHPTENRTYLVVARSKVTGDMEPLHPGSTDLASARRLVRCVDPIPVQIWTLAEWNEYDDKIRAEVFCPECGEERELCKCEAKEA